MGTGTQIMVVAILLSAIIVGLMVREIFQIRRATRETRLQIVKTIEAIKNALQQVESEQEEDILAGLQTLSVLNSPLRLKALPRLIELVSNDNKRVAKHARSAIERIKDSPGHTGQAVLHL